MKLTDSPTLFPQPFARDADPRLVNATLPETTSDSGRVSLLGGFPIANFTALSAGGKPVDGVDMQTLFHMLSIVARAVEAGQVRQWDGGYGQTIGGYPAGAVVSGSTPDTLYVSLVDDNLTDPAVDINRVEGKRSWAAVGNGQGVLSPLYEIDVTQSGNTGQYQSEILPCITGAAIVQGDNGVADMSAQPVQSIGTTLDYLPGDGTDLFFIREEARLAVKILQDRQSYLRSRDRAIIFQQAHLAEQKQVSLIAKIEQAAKKLGISL